MPQDKRQAARQRLYELLQEAARNSTMNPQAWMFGLTVKAWDKWQSANGNPGAFPEEAFAEFTRRAVKYVETTCPQSALLRETVDVAMVACDNFVRVEVRAGKVTWTSGTMFGDVRYAAQTVIACACNVERGTRSYAVFSDGRIVDPGKEHREGDPIPGIPRDEH